MSYQRRVLSLSLALVVLSMGATVGCRAEGLAAPRTVSGSQNTTLLLCTAVFSRCDSTVLSSQTTTHNPGRLISSKDRPPQIVSVARGVNTGWQTADRSVSSRNVNFSVASMGADTDADMGRLVLNVTLDSYYQGTIYNSQAPFEPMQVSLNYIRAW